jgi:hypothetical protein
MEVTDQVSSVKPFPSITVNLQENVSLNKEKIIDSNIFFRQADEPVTWSHPPD